MSLSLRSARYWFYLEDLMTGENRDVVTDPGGTEQDARNLLGGSWTDPRAGHLPWAVPAGGGHTELEFAIRIVARIAPVGTRLLKAAATEDGGDVRLAERRK